MLRFDLSTVDSTNAWAKRNLALCDPAQVTMIVAGQQTAGKGQWGRVWHSPPGQLYVTFVLFGAQADPLLIGRLLQSVLTGVPIEIRPPNDLMVEGRKLGGILLETSGDALIIGIGLNLDLPPQEQAKIDQPATGILQVTGRPADKEAILSLLEWELSQLRDHD